MSVETKAISVEIETMDQNKLQCRTQSEEKANWPPLPVEEVNIWYYLQFILEIWRISWLWSVIHSLSQSLTVIFKTLFNLDNFKFQPQLYIVEKFTLKITKISDSRIALVTEKDEVLTSKMFLDIVRVITTSKFRILKTFQEGLFESVCVLIHQKWIKEIFFLLCFWIIGKLF